MDRQVSERCNMSYPVLPRLRCDLEVGHLEDHSGTAVMHPEHNSTETRHYWINNLAYTRK